MARCNAHSKRAEAQYGYQFDVTAEGIGFNIDLDEEQVGMDAQILAAENSEYAQLLNSTLGKPSDDVLKAIDDVLLNTDAGATERLIEIADRIKAEKDHTLNLGIESSLWNNRLQLAVGYYDVRAKDVLITGVRSSPVMSMAAPYFSCR